LEPAPNECICCGRTERSPLIRIGEWTVQKCSGCGLGVLDPRPDPLELDALYRESYFVSHYEEVLELGSPGMERRISQEAHRIRFFRKFRKKGLVLDIGCGRGYFLHACRIRGYDVVGMDVSEDASLSVWNALRIPVKAGALREELFEPESIDVITMWHALEHTADPERYIDQAWRWLRPDGLLVIDVPNYEGTDARRIGAAWDGWSLPYHLFHFTPATLEKMISRHGFQALRSKDYHSDYVKGKLRKIPIVGLLARPIAKFFSGTSYAVVAGKTARTRGGGLNAAAK
jgi:2-polyprenyl-3-methyl-5-hydroxy-6-metoxy-1,4-benzoquinol methylase